MGVVNKVEVTANEIFKVLTRSTEDLLTTSLADFQTYLDIFHAVFKELSTDEFQEQLLETQLFSSKEAKKVIEMISKSKTFITHPTREYLVAFSVTEKTLFFQRIDIDERLARKLSLLIEANPILDQIIRNYLTYPTEHGLFQIKEEIHLHQLRSLINRKIAQIDSRRSDFAKARIDHLEFLNLLISFSKQDKSIRTQIASLFDSPSELMELAMQFHLFNASKLKLEDKINEKFKTYAFNASSALLKTIVEMITLRAFLIETTGLIKHDEKLLSTLKDGLKAHNIKIYQSEGLQKSFIKRKEMMQAHAILAFERLGFIKIQPTETLRVIEPLF